MYSSSITKTQTARYTMEGIEDMIPTQWSPIKISYDKDDALRISHWGPQHQQFYRAMINKVSKHEVFRNIRILSVVSVQMEKKSSYGYLKEIVVRRADQKLYKFKEGDFQDLHLNDIEDMLRLIAQNNLFNLEVKESYTLNFDPPRVIYEEKSKKKRLMHVDEIHKFCDRTLQSIRNILHERLLNFKFGYNKGMPSREWTTKDKRRTCIMLNKIDDQLFKRLVLRSLEVLVGGRKTETDKRLLQRTVIRVRSNAHAGNPVKEILFNLNLPDHRSVLTEPEVHVKMEMEIPRSSRFKFITACSYSVNKYKDMMKAQVHVN
ncbi:hypothetical protein Tco_0352696 [Tanacetum coccineum]